MARYFQCWMSIATVSTVGHLLGYARVSTTDQDAALQVDALTAAGCYRVFVDTISGSLDHRPELTKLMDQLRPGDTLVVWRLDRLGRSIRHLIDQLQILSEQGVGFRSLQETIDTTSSGGRLVFHVFAALAEFERDLIRERLVVIWHLLSEPHAHFHDLGADHYARSVNTEARKRNHVQQLEALGYRVTLEPAA